MKTTKLIAVMVIVFSVAACNSSQKNTLQFNSFIYTSTPEDSIADKFVVNIDISYPTTYTNAVVLQTIQRDIIATITGDSGFYKPNINECINNYVTDRKAKWKISLEEISQVIKNKNIPFVSQLNIRAESPYMDASILSYKTTVYSFSGGAHGTTTITYRSYDLLTGKVFAESDIFESEYNEILSNCMLEKLEENCLKSNIDPQQYYLDKVVPNGNYFLNKKGITYLFNQYEIAPYAYGQTEIFIPYKDIESIIKEDSPIVKFLQ